MISLPINKVVSFVNLTADSISYYGKGQKLQIPPSGTVVRFKCIQTMVQHVLLVKERMVIQINHRETPQGRLWDVLEGLPGELEASTFYIVSNTIAQFARHPNIVCPDSPFSDYLNGAIGCNAFVSYG